MKLNMERFLHVYSGVQEEETDPGRNKKYLARVVICLLTQM